MTKFTLEDFVIESNRIEGITRTPDILKREVKVTKMFFTPSEWAVIADLKNYVNTIQPGAVLRSQDGMNVMVGDYIPPPGGPEIAFQLAHLLGEVFSSTFSSAVKRQSAYDFHIRYEKLHPFTDGNGRSGRLLWLCLMGGIERVPLGFLHTFYYQTLSRSKKEVIW